MKFKELPRNLRPIFRPLKPPKPMGAYRVVGWDTEADRKGNIYLLCNSSRQESVLIAPKGQCLKTEEMLAFLWSRGRDNNGFQKVNFFHNLDYDMRGILKQFLLSLPDNKRKGVVKARKVRIGEYLVRWRKGKYFMVSKHGNQARFFDLLAHLKGSLDSLGQKYLGEGKGEYADLDIQAGREKYSDEVLIGRCSRDSIITRSLGEMWILTVRQIFAPSKIWTGTARLAEEYVRLKVPAAVLHPFVNSAKHRSVVQYFYRAFFGGRFDLCVKGHVRDAFEMDVSSMYPSFIRDLVALNTGDWRYSFEYHKDAVYGVYHVRTEFLNGILPYRTEHGRILYPHLRGKPREAYVVKCELEALQNCGARIEILDCFEYFADIKVHPFRGLIDGLYRAKSEAGKKGEVGKRTALKLIMNSMYGKTAQAKGGVGALFNPVYAAEITARGRLQILELSQEWYAEPYEIKTDAVVGRPKDDRLLKLVPLADSHVADVGGRGVWEILFPEKLGAFVPKPRQHLDRINIQTGVTLSPRTGKSLDEGYEFIHFRGFSIKGKRVEAKPDKIVVWSERPVSMSEAAIQDRVEEINEFKRFRKEVSIFDRKRVWPVDLTTEKLEKERIRGETIESDYLDALEKEEMTLDSLGSGTYWFAKLYEAEVRASESLKETILRNQRKKGEFAALS